MVPTSNPEPGIPQANPAVTSSQQVKALLQQLISTMPKGSMDLENHAAISESLDEMAKNSAPLHRQLHDGVCFYLRRMVELDASDIEIGGYGAGGHIWYRVYGEKKPDKTLGEFTQNETTMLIMLLLSRQQLATLYKVKNLDFSYTFSEGEAAYRFRANAYYDFDQLALKMRLITTQIFPIASLGFHPNVLKMFNLLHDKWGLTLVTGITGSGKTTTLDSIIDMNNQLVDGHIIIISSPVEFVHTSQRCIIRHREVGRDVLSFNEGVVQCLRQDPDIVVIGEMRDPGTIINVLEVTDSGHKIFSTLHTSSAVESIDRIIGEMDSYEKERVRMRLADTLKVVVAQKLLPSLDGKRVLAKEVMINTPSVRAAIRNNNTGEIYQMISESNDSGMITLEQDLRRLYRLKKISLEMAMDFANNKRRLHQLLQMK